MQFEIDDKETHEVLLAKIVQELLTISGFAIAGEWMEKFKYTTKKSTQCTRSSQNELCSYSTDE